MAFISFAPLGHSEKISKTMDPVLAVVWGAPQAEGNDVPTPPAKDRVPCAGKDELWAGFLIKPIGVPLEFARNLCNLPKKVFGLCGTHVVHVSSTRCFALFW